MRLTNKDGTYTHHLVEYYKGQKCEGNIIHNNLATKKLSQLEDLEEELGIELILYFKIYKHCLKNKPIYYIKNNKIVKSSPRVECCLDAVAEHIGDYGADEYDFKDYGKTWALTKEELEHE